MARIREDDETAFKALFEHYFLPLSRYASAIIDNRETAFELVQDVLLVVWVRRRDIEIHTSLATYLYSALRNAALNARRRSGLAIQMEALARDDFSPGMGSAPIDSLTSASLDERAHILRTALDRLTPRRREVVLLRWMSEMTNGEIAKVLGISVRTVESTHARAIDDLTVLLRDRFP